MFVKVVQYQMIICRTSGKGKFSNKTYMAVLTAEADEAAHQNTFDLLIDAPTLLIAR